jgi:hypothetical protein
MRGAERKVVGIKAFESMVQLERGLLQTVLL